ncbi:MAG: hypothetical protein D6705_00585 [Deltaproteobacteria bacterium]|nr:MAG: hypothetical protein D6705_00585 [Deltaproteobacteria bacterium]
MRLAPALVPVLVAACVPPLVVPEGLLDRPLPLWSGDGVDAPRLAFVDEGCPGSEIARGGCPMDDPERVCRPILLDSLAPETALPDPSLAGDELSLSAECLELRPAAGLGAPTPSAQDLARSVARLRLTELPVIRTPAPDAEPAAWSWRHGTEANVTTPGGILGAHALATFAVRFETEAVVPTVTFYDAFPGSDRDLARKGYAFLPVQYPGRLLGRQRDDRCLVDGRDCELPKGVDLVPGDDRLALAASRMVLDACLAPPPCTVTYTPDADDPTQPGTCGLAPGPDAGGACVRADASMGGRSATLVVATSVTDVALFSDAFERMFGPVDALPPCTVAPTPQTQVCATEEAGRLYVAGWPPAGEDVPLPVVRLRSLAILPGAVEPVAPAPCTRLAERLVAAENQCDRYRRSARQAGSIAATSPPYSANPGDADDDADASALVLGEAFLPAGSTAPATDRWITARILPADHPLAVSVRRSVAPDGIEPDGLLGTAMLAGTDLVLDYTDPNPSLRARCTAPAEGGCLALTDCRDDGDAACCHGMPRSLLLEFAVGAGHDTCCHALDETDRQAVADAGGPCTPP